MNLIQGAVSTCWSPGQRDTDCPNSGLCCFDGCANTCGDAPQGKDSFCSCINMEIGLVFAYLVLSSSLQFLADANGM